MGFLSLLGKIAGGLTGFGSVLGAQEGSKTQGKIQQADLNQRQDQNATSLYQAQQNAQQQQALTDLQRKQFESTNRGSTAKQALIGALLGGGMTPTSISGGKASGGLLQSLNANPDALAAMKTLGSQGATAQATPLQFQGGNMVKPPTLTPLQQVDNGGFLSTLARIAQLGGTIDPSVFKPKNGGDGQYDSSGSYLGE